MNAIALAERGWIPDFLIRWGIRRMLAGRLEKERRTHFESLNELVAELQGSPIALATDKANQQHYEVPPAFFVTVLGARLKYSATYWPEGVHDLDASELASLELVGQRAELADGQEILELGCGWGSFSLWAAERFPHSRILGVSNSRTQREYILAQASLRHLKNLEIVTADMNHFETARRFDRVVSIEMFEHMRNYGELLRRIHSWLKDDGLLFVHIFTHLYYAYPFVVDGDRDWMAKYFFTGGLMPSDSLLFRFANHLRVRQHWRLDGRHYQKTCEAWLRRQDANRTPLLQLFAKTYGEKEALLWFHRWRLFFLACSELFGYRGGREWIVSHYLFEKQPTPLL